MSQKQSITIPASMVVELEEWGKLTSKLFGKLRQQANSTGTSVDQSWFWSDSWQSQEKDADRNISEEKFYQFDSAKDAIKHLHDEAKKYEA